VSQEANKIDIAMSQGVGPVTFAHEGDR